MVNIHRNKPDGKYKQFWTSKSFKNDYCYPQQFPSSFGGQTWKIEPNLVEIKAAVYRDYGKSLYSLCIDYIIKYRVVKHPLGCFTIFIGFTNQLW